MSILINACWNLFITGDTTGGEGGVPAFVCDFLKIMMLVLIYCAYVVAAAYKSPRNSHRQLLNWVLYALHM